MGDPFLHSSASDNASEIGHRQGMSRRPIPASVIPASDRPNYVGDLVKNVSRLLVCSGFQRDTPDNPIGGFAMTQWSDTEGVRVSWITRGDCEEPLESRVSGIMTPALAAILTSSGFTVELVPASDSDSQHVWVLAGPVSGRVGDI